MYRSILLIVLVSLLLIQLSYAANKIDLSSSQNTVLHALFGAPSNKLNFQEINRFTDFNLITHIRMQEYFGKYVIHHAQMIIHIESKHAHEKNSLKVMKSLGNKKTLSGIIYTQLEADLLNQRPPTLNSKQSDLAVNIAKNDYLIKKSNNNLIFKNFDLQVIIWLDKFNKAHWAYKITFNAKSIELGKLPARPTYIIGANDLNIYQSWDNIKTTNKNNFVKSGGWGGNSNSGRLIYDGSHHQLPYFLTKRENGICYFENDEISIKNAKTGDIVSFPCKNPDVKHNSIYWFADFDHINGGFSPTNDAMFSAQTIKSLYKYWYHLPALSNPDGKEMRLIMNVHEPRLDNAYWDGESMTFGDGDILYPLTSLGIAAHEISHGFTEQHSNLEYIGESGGMNEAFSDMAAQVAEFYIFNKNSWLIGSEIFKIPQESLRFMDTPSKDCYGKTPGTYCSIDHIDQYYEGLDVHYSSGIYNRIFYLMSTKPGWNPKKAFAVMVQANASYWTSATNFVQGAACLLKAARDLNYNYKDIELAFKKVGIEKLPSCTNHDGNL